MTIYTKYLDSSSSHKEFTTSLNVLVNAKKVTDSSITLENKNEFKIDEFIVESISTGDGKTKKITDLKESTIMINENGKLVVYSKDFINLSKLFLHM